MITINQILNDPILFGLYLVMGLVAFALFYYMYNELKNDLDFKRRHKNA